MNIFKMLLIDLAMIGLTMIVIQWASRTKIKSIIFYIIAAISLVVTVIADQVMYKLMGKSSLWTGALASSVLTISYLVITKAKACKKEGDSGFKR